jgi:hypothetical protein
MHYHLENSPELQDSGFREVVVIMKCRTEMRTTFPPVKNEIICPE